MSNTGYPGVTAVKRRGQSEPWAVLSYDPDGRRHAQSIKEFGYEGAVQEALLVQAGRSVVPTAPHVVTAVEEMLRQQRPAGDTRDPREPVCKTPRGAIPGATYLIADEQGRLKIGASEGAAANVLNRRAELQVGNADDLTIIGFIETDDVYALEASLKAEFAAYRVRGEWFSANGDITRRFGA